MPADALHHSALLKRGGKGPGDGGLAVGRGYLVHVDGVEAHLRRGELGEQRAAAEPRIAVGHAAERRHK